MDLSRSTFNYCFAKKIFKIILFKESLGTMLDIQKSRKYAKACIYFCYLCNICKYSKKNVALELDNSSRDFLVNFEELCIFIYCIYCKFIFCFYIK
ncbi:hypothetical protein M9H77_19966 [Catharanthus roseus]|uniref:Uncharacterized protein n=1 Tax=Catharanthus roseus TaxID=4058 RepID=A0ACC0AIB7_CATRO|nr:hypothetical protein M9H77_19966 [Catharanthus roseus]